MPRRSKSKRLEPVSRLARDAEDKAAVALAECMRDVQLQEQRLAELEGFRGEYRERLEMLGGQGVRVDRLNEYRRFIDQLDRTIAQQRNLVEESRRRLELQNRNWTESRSKRRALDKAIDRFRAGEERVVHEREQLESDERAQRPGAVDDEA